MAKNELTMVINIDASEASAELDKLMATAESAGERIRESVNIFKEKDAEIQELKAEMADLEAEMERRDKVSRERYAALERDRDNVERIMREASQRADQNERNLKIVLDREGELKNAMRTKVLRYTERVEALDWHLGSIDPATDRRKGIRRDLGEAREGIRALLADLKGE